MNFVADFKKSATKFIPLKDTYFFAIFADGLIYFYEKVT